MNRTEAMLEKKNAVKREKFRWHFFGLLLIALVLIGLGVLFYSLLSKNLLPTAQNMDKVVVSGVGEAKAAPDQASVVFTVESSGATSAEAAKINSRDTNRLLEALSKVAPSVSDKKITTANFNIYPIYAPGATVDGKPINAVSNPLPAIVGYRASNSILVQVSQIPTAMALQNLVSQLIDTATRESGINAAVSSVEFDQSEKLRSALLLEARTNAVLNSKNAASTLADTAGRTLGQVIAMSEGAVAGGGLPPMFLSARAKSIDSADSATPISAPTEMKVSTNVDVHYRLL